MKNFKILVFIITSLFLITNCSKDDEQVTEPGENMVSQIVSPQGGTVNGPNDIQVIIPAGTTTVPIKVEVGYTNTEPTTLPNNKMEVIGKSFTFRTDATSIQNDIQFIMPIPNGFNSQENNAVFCSVNPKISLKWIIEAGKLKITLDKGAFEILKAASTGQLAELVFIFTQNRQLGLASEMGLKQVSIVNNNFSLITPTAITQNDKILLLIHGWTDSPTSCWKDFLLSLNPQITNCGYTKIMTFGYYSGLAINTNGQLLASHLQNTFNNATVDIIAHSMGGLVSRSAIENYNSANKVRNLITLGTPHKGSIGGDLRKFVGELIKDGLSPSLNQSYIAGSQGWDDLSTTSAFITSLNSISYTPSTNYYPIAAKYSNADFDLVVTKSSALGTPGNTNMTIGQTFVVAGAVPHSAMKTDPAVITHVASKLNSFNSQNTTNPYLNPNLTYSSVTDIDGNVYSTIQIGTQIWMAENLKTSKYNDGNIIQNVTTNWGNLTSGAWCYYNNNQSNNQYYGKLYNWYAVNSGKLCPNGWRIPSQSDFIQLETYLGGEGTAGGKMKSTGLWNYPNSGGTNSSGFTALPGGYRTQSSTNEGFEKFGSSGYFWSSTADGNPLSSWGILLYTELSNSTINTVYRNQGNSCRCIKN